MAISEAAAALRREWAGRGRPVLLDIGAGGGWAARYLRDADVIAIDLLAAKARPGELRVRGDMRRLPFGDSTIDVAFYAASLHYAPVEDSIREASRVLRHGGLLVAVDSPMYPDARAQSRARVRSTIYYSKAGFPELAAHYHPIDTSALRVALAGAGFEVRLLDAGQRAGRWWDRPRTTRRFSVLVARYA